MATTSSVLPIFEYVSKRTTESKKEIAEAISNIGQASIEAGDDDNPDVTWKNGADRLKQAYTVLDDSVVFEDLFVAPVGEAGKQEIKVMKDWLTTLTKEHETLQAMLKNATATSHSTSKFSAPQQVQKYQVTTPAKWRGEGDKRSPQEYVKTMCTFVKFELNIPEHERLSQLSRVMMSNMSTQAMKTAYQTEFEEWEVQKKKDDNTLLGTSIYPDLKDIEVFISKGLTVLKSNTDIMNQLIDPTETFQKKPGLIGLNAFITDIKEKIARLTAGSTTWKADLLMIKTIFAKRLDDSVRKHVNELLTPTSIESDESWEKFIENIEAMAVSKMRGLKDEKTKQLWHIGNPKGGGKDRGGKGKGKGKGKGTKGGKKGGKGTKGGKNTAKRGREEKLVCSLCGYTGHEKKTCFQDAANADKRPDGFKVLNADELADRVKRLKTDH